jgi:hypothetical protein
VPDEIDQIGTTHRIAAGQDEHGRDVAERSHLIDEPEPLLGRQLVWIPAGNRIGAAVQAGERARRVTSQMTMKGIREKPPEVRTCGRGPEAFSVAISGLRIVDRPRRSV